MGRLVVVSNRLPFSAVEENGSLRFTETTGGLVTGMRAALEALKARAAHDTEYLWVGWPGGTIPPHLNEALKTGARTRFNSHPVLLSEREMDQFYFGFCNKTIWPLFHYFPSYAVYREELWQQYRHVNEVFCENLVQVLQPEDIVWVHDYHLLLLPQMLRARIPDVRIGFFLHIPFPSFEVFRLLPGKWRREILEGLLGADLLGFHTYEYTQYFLQCVLRILRHEHNMGQIVAADRIVKVGTFPMGIDFDKFSEALSDPEVKAERDALRSSLAGVRVILSVDRLDYTKGILQRLQGFEILLETQAQYHGKVALIMIVVPSRIGVEEYDQMKRQIEELVGKINGKFGHVGWTPVIYQYRYVPFHPLVALYSASDIALVTPLRDGMNLVAKEYIATRVDSTGTLVLSEMAGAAKELGEAVIINPNNREEIAEALKVALEIPPDEQQRHNQVMRDRLRRYNVVRWAQDFVQELLTTRDAQQKFCAKLLPNAMKYEIASQYTRATRRILFLDYDGTLMPFVSQPTMARPTAEITATLARLAQDPRNLLVLISGRERERLQEWFGELPISLVAEHGIWIRETDGSWRMLKQQTREWMPTILPILQLYADRLPGSFVEEKEFSLVWHYRAADPDQSQVLAGELMDHLVTFTANIDLQVMRGHKVIEVRTAGVNKGTAALDFIRRETFDFVLAIGDDWTDEDMFGVLPDWSYSVRVGIANTRARYNLRNPREVMRMLDLLMKPSVQVSSTVQAGK